MKMKKAIHACNHRVTRESCLVASTFVSSCSRPSVTFGSKSVLPLAILALCSFFSMKKRASVAVRNSANCRAQITNCHPGAW